MKLLDIVLLGIYLALMAAATWALYAARRATSGEEHTRQVREYRVWMQEAWRQSAGEGPVKRRPPNSTIPPRVVLLRDYFHVCLVAIWVLGTGTIGTLLFLVRGALNGSPSHTAIATASNADPDQ